MVRKKIRNYSLIIDVMTHRKALTQEEFGNLQAEILPLTRGFDLIADHVVITDADGIILYANKAVERHTGFLISEVIGKTPGDLWGSNMEKEFYENMWRTIKTDKIPFRGQVQNRNKDGIMYWQELRIVPILGENGEAKFFIGMEPDITVQKVKEGHQEQYIEEMERLNTYLEGREVKMKELVEKVAELEKKLQASGQ